MAGGAASEGGILSLHAAACISAAVLGWRVQRASKTESVEKGHHQQEAHHTEYDDDDDDVSVHEIFPGWRAGEDSRGGALVPHFIPWAPEGGVH